MYCNVLYVNVFFALNDILQALLVLIRKKNDFGHEALTFSAEPNKEI